ncbi:MAG: gliding motility-associated C-terminal domain-containing protein [Cyclobacteriaceae bacterium]
MDNLDGGKESAKRKTKIMRTRYLISLLFFFNITLAVGQNLAQHNWYFGNTKDGIRFNRGTNKSQAVTNQSIPFGTGGSAVATDPATANLLFYTDGTRVYDGCHLAMPNGTGLLGNSSANQPAVICPVPGQPDKYYIFTNSANFTTGGSIASSVVDLSQLGNAAAQPGLGVVEAANKNAAVPGLANRSESMIVIPHFNGTDYWLVTHQNGSADYSATLINAASYTAGTFTTTLSSGVGGPPAALPITVSNFSYNHKLKKLAVSVQSTKDDSQILNFNPTTGAITFDRYILNSGVITATSPSMYDIQWDIKGGQYLYISRIGEPGIPADVLQYDYINSTSTTTIFSSVLSSAVSATISKSFGLQLAPDSAIYHLYQVTTGEFLIEKFTKTDTIAAEVIKTLAPFGNIDFKATQFPAFLPQSNVNLVVDFTSTASAVGGNCQNNPITFFPDVKPNADSLSWDFGDGGPKSKAWSPVHTFAQAQTFNVALTAFYQGQKKTTTKPITITAFTVKLQLVQDTTACKCQLPANKVPCSSLPLFSVTAKTTGGTSTPTFLWSDLKTNNATFFPDSAGYYYVVATDGTTGCSVYGGVNVKEYGKQDQRSNIWYFGNKAGIDFNPTTPPTPPPPRAIINKSAMDAPEGCAIVCDRNGQAIFYTDGKNVYDKTNTSIANDLAGDPDAAQSSLIVPVPGDETLYYIFTTQVVTGTSLNELRYSIFDLKGNGGKGAITQKNVLLFARSTERITSNGQWLIAHEYGNSTFRSYRITNQGIGEAVYSDIGSVHSFKTKENGEGYMKLGPRDNLAVALSTPGTSNIIELFQLNDTTGTIRNYRKVDMNQPTGQVYGIEFSPGGRKLFATIKGAPSPSYVYEYYLDSLDIKVPVLVPPSPIQRSAELGALQLAPDGQIYIAINNAAQLGSFQANENKISTPTSFNFSAPPTLSPGTSKLGLPNFIQQQGNAFGGPDFTVTGLCQKDTAKFVGTPTDAIDTFLWTFGDGATSTELSPKHFYTLPDPLLPNTYTVTFQINNRCLIAEGKPPIEITKQVTINPSPPTPTVAPASVLCNGPVTLDANIGNLPNTAYAWTNGATTKTVTITRPAVISVTNTDANGCTSKARAIVGDGRPILNLGPDITICQNNAVNNLIVSDPDPSNPNDIIWTLNGAVNGNISTTQAVDTSLPVVLTYGVTLIAPPVPSTAPPCTVTDDKVITVKVSPDFTLTGTNPTNCNLADGTVNLSINTTTPAGGPYSYFISGPSFSNQDFDKNAPFTTGNLPGVRAGTISGIVTDQISGCTISSAIGLTDPAPYVINTSVVGLNCDPVTLAVTTTPPVQLNQYQITNSGTGVIVDGPTTFSPTKSNFNTKPLPQGTYIIEVKDVGGCTVTKSVPVTPVPAPIISISQNCLTLTASGAASYSWTTNVSGSIVGPTNAPTIQMLGGAGTVTYTVSDPTAVCPGQQSVTVTVPGAITPNFTQTDGCSSQVTLTAIPAGNFRYTWYKNSSSLALGRQIVLGLTEDGASYAVEIFDALSGCTIRSAAKLVQVSGPVDASVTGTQACQDDKGFTLTAATTASNLRYAWALNNTVITGQTTSTLKETREGTYKVTVSKATCSASATIQIIKAPLPQGELKDRLIICNDPDNKDPLTSEADLDPGAFSKYSWSEKTKGVLNNINRVFPAKEAGIYIVDLTNSFGCTNTDQTEVLNECIPTVVGPNAFRPANAVNSINKDFFVYSFFITDTFEVAIFNRWGEIVYESKDRNFKWNGGYGGNSGQPLPGGTYSYVIRYQSSFRPQDGIKEKRGGVVLLR